MVVISCTAFFPVSLEGLTSTEFSTSKEVSDSNAC